MSRQNPHAKHASPFTATCARRGIVGSMSSRRMREVMIISTRRLVNNPLLIRESVKFPRYSVCNLSFMEKNQQRQVCHVSSWSFLSTFLRNLFHLQTSAASHFYRRLLIYITTYTHHAPFTAPQRDETNVPRPSSGRQSPQSRTTR